MGIFWILVALSIFALGGGIAFLAVGSHRFAQAFRSATGVTNFLAPAPGPVGVQRRQTPCTQAAPCIFGLVADLDKGSVVQVVGRPDAYRSILASGSIYKDGSSYYLSQGKTRNLQSTFNFNGHGMELNELLFSSGRLLSFDEATGLVYEVLPNGQAPVPRHVITAGDGSFGKPMQPTWAAEKDGDLWIGSRGREITSASTGQIDSAEMMWVAVINRHGTLSRRDWNTQYAALRSRLGAQFPGYLTHEAIRWSQHLNKWVVLPRRVSTTAYDPTEDQTKGSNALLLATEDFSSVTTVQIGTAVPEKGYTSFQFVPGTNDEVILAVRTQEEGDTQTSYLTVFETSTGSVLMADVAVNEPGRFAGVEFIPEEIEGIFD